MNSLKKMVLFLSVITASGLVMVTIYNSMVDARSWGADIPGSINTARAYYKYVDPRNFFVVFGPVNQLLILLTIILFWKDSVSLRYCFALAFLFYAFIIALTLAYFIPRDIILFSSNMEGNINRMKTTMSEWKLMNWLRTLLGLAGIVCSFVGLDRYYKLTVRN